MDRSLSHAIREALRKKIVLISGPRQSGKTYLSRGLLHENADYLNFDSAAHRSVIRAQSWDRDSTLLVLDELHKMKNWKSWLKGIYDVEGLNPPIVVTGSSRMDTFKKTGDSLAGRHRLFRLHPLSVKEVQDLDSRAAFDLMLKLGSFPEPFLDGDQKSANLWRRSHLDIILRQDLLDLEKVRELKSIEILVELLSERVGSTLSYASLARDLEVSPHTVKHWIQILESLFVIFVVTPYSKNIAKAILKEPKVYFYDTGRVMGDAARLENLIACHLHKRNQFLEDTEGRRIELHYIKDKEKREVDFAILEDRRISHLIEVKESDASLSPALRYYEEKLKPEHCIQAVHHLKSKLKYGPIKVLAADQFCLSLEA